MPISQQRLGYLLEAYSNGSASNDEVNELYAWIQENDDPEPIREHIRRLIASYDPTESAPAVDWEELFQRVRQRSTDEPIPTTPHTLGETAERQPIRRISWFRAIAASILFIIGGILLVYLLKSCNQQRPNTTAATLTNGADKPMVKIIDNKKHYREK